MCDCVYNNFLGQPYGTNSYSKCVLMIKGRGRVEKSYVLNGWPQTNIVECFLCNGTAKYTKASRPEPNWPNGWVFVYELSGSGFESNFNHLNFRFRGCFEEGVDIQTTTECGFTPKRIRDMTKFEFELVTREFELVTRGSELTFLNFNSCF